MRKNAVIAAVAAIVFAVAGFFLRRVQIMTGFEPSGLALRGAAITTLMPALAAVVVIAAVAIATIVKIRANPVTGYKNAFADGGLSYFVLVLALGFAWAVASAAHFVSLRASGAMTRGDIVFCLLSILAALSVIFLAHSSYTGRKYGMSLIFTVVPEIFFCFWLVVLYRDNQTNPVFAKYVYECLAIAATTLSFYSVTAYAYGKATPGLAVLGFATSVFFSAVTLADPIATPLRVIFAAILILQTGNLARFAYNLQSKSAKSAVDDAKTYLGLNEDEYEPDEETDDD
jgi:hypothetical protein